MGTIRARRQDGSTLEVRTTKKTRHVRLAHESLVWVDLSALGETPALTEISLSYRTALEGLDLGRSRGTRASSPSARRWRGRSISRHSRAATR